MKILVTGAAGFIGGNFIYHMQKAHPDYELVALDSLTYAGNLETLDKALKKDNTSFVRVDITDREAVFGLFAKEKGAYRPYKMLYDTGETH